MSDKTSFPGSDARAVLQGTPSGKEEAHGMVQCIEVWPIAQLKTHPRQDSNFHPLTYRELQRLTDDMMVNGQTTPIEVLPDGTIIAGHQRRRAAERLGWTELIVWVRHDLAGDAFAAERRMIEDNLAKRQLDVLDQVRASKRLVELQRRTSPGGLSGHQQHDLRDEIANVLGKSGRHVQRYLNVLKSAMPIQRLVSTGKLTLKLAEQVTELPEAVQVQIARAIEEGGKAAEVVTAHLPEAVPAGVDVQKELTALVKAGTRALDTLRGHEKEIALPSVGTDVTSSIRTLKKLPVLITKIVNRLELQRKERATNMKAITKLASRSRSDSWD